ncbi:hypothetical protein F5X68DRAFT_52513 [Plectosphaerella plurivora]|uniref:Uncharacterized protein n=1 Tax=Plectosphaerella plurivora TaxID=936078 RepID=A0A9P8V3F2_9PEZI|nr:hypothetical protein F5X68DRAFT_52513 [Plectosphaerella plurivora]
MATDADVVTPADTSATSDAKLTTHADVDSDNGVLDRAILNGSPGQDEIENKHITNVEDQINSADVSVSGGSDTEASRGDSKSKDGSQVRSSSAKKPATFKAVSVNKTFLAKGPASIPAVKTADKSNASSLSTTPTGVSALSSRPRLIAKTGSGAGTGPKFASTINGAKGATGPDASAVWNKNRPVPPPEPKKFTDEELKKFGIHMASRLGPESSQGQNNWADIEDDDDWAPDTITWTDGTKVTLPQQPEEHQEAHLPSEPIPIPAQAPRLVSMHAPTPAATAAPAPAVREPLRLTEKSRSPAPPETASPSSRPATLPSGKGMILKAGGSAEKPALVAKPPAVTGPAKSPWAKLPPVDKTSPVDHQSGPQGHHQHLPVRDHHLQSISPPPTREIAADDFNRSTWREGPTAGNRELFNSHSGRYEPVERRGSMRSDSRQPQLLPRPSHSDHPEPSAAFQTTRTQQEAPFGRRRNSSNLSGTGYPPRPPFGPHDHQTGLRRPSVTASIESSHSPQLRHISPVDGQGPQRLHPNQNWQPRASPSITQASLHAPAAAPVPAEQVPEVPTAEDYEYQKKIMHEKRELAMQRRREQEAREEAEKKERLQAKLAALGPAPERKSARKEASHHDTSGAVHIQQRQQSKNSDDSKQSKESPKTGQATAAQTEEVTDAAAKPVQESAHSRNRQDLKHGADQAENSAPRNRQENKASWGQGAAPQSDRYTASWAPAVQPTSSSVWAPPTNTRGLGNGTFGTPLGRGPASPDAAAAQPVKGPAPIGPPSVQRQANAPAAQPAHPGHAGAPPRHESALLRSRWSSSVVDNDRVMMDQSRARNAEQERQLAERGLTLADSIPEIKDNWRPHDPHPGMRAAPDLSRSTAPTGPTRPEFTAPSGPGSLSGSGQPPILPTTSSASQSRTSRFFPPTRDVRNEIAQQSEPQRPKSPSPPPPDTVGHPAFDGDIHRPHVSLPRPQPVVRLPPSAAAAQDAPAARPAANFSWANPTSYKDTSAAVPTGPAGQSRDWERQPATHRHVPTSSQDSNGGWDERFRNLLSDRKAPRRKVTSPSQATFVDASSRNVLDQSNRHEMATVSLPRTPTTQSHSRTIVQDAALFTMGTTTARKHFNAAPGAYMVKPVSEECFKEQEMGSLPAINLPRVIPDNGWQPAPQPADKRGGFRRFTSADISSVGPHWIPTDMSPAGTPEYRIKFPGMLDVRTTPAPNLPSRGSTRTRSNKGPRQPQGGSRGGKNSEANSQAGDAPASALPPSRPQGRGGRSSYRGKGSDWNRRTSSAQPTQ